MHLLSGDPPAVSLRQKSFRRYVSLTHADVRRDTRTTNRLLTKSASIVLASLRGSTYRSVRLASSLTAALLDGLSEQPVGHSASVIDPRRGVVSGNAISFVNKLLSNPCTRFSRCPNFLSLDCKSLSPCGESGVRESDAFGQGYLIPYTAYPRRYSPGQTDTRKGQKVRNSACYWWRCFIAAAQRRIKMPIQRAACWKGITS